MRATVVGLLLLAVATASPAQGGPKISFDRVTHDYGRILYGDTVTEEFAFANTGDATLNIEKLAASCDCTKALRGSSEIPPGGKGTIIASFDTTDLSPGKKQKTIFVHSNDPQEPMVKLTLLAEVVREIMVSPPTLAKKLTKGSDTVTFPLQIANSGKTPCSVSGLKVTESNLVAALKPGQLIVEPGRSASADVELKLEKEPDKSLYIGKLVIVTDHPREKEIDLRYVIQTNQAE